MSSKISINDIDTVTSATITSKAVMNAVNDALAQFNELSITPAPLPEGDTNETEVKTDEKQ